MLLGILVVFEMAADAAGLRENLLRFGDTEDAVIHRRTHAGVGFLAWSIQSSCRENENSIRRQGGADFSEHGFLFAQGKVPDAVPGGDEVVFAGKRPSADVRLVDGDVGM